MYPWYFYIIGTIGSLILTASYLPDMLAAFKADTLQGASWKTPAMVCVGLTCAMVCNAFTGNWPFFINDLICVLFSGGLLWLRWKKRPKESHEAPRSSLPGSSPGSDGRSSAQLRSGSSQQ